MIKYSRITDQMITEVGDQVLRNTQLPKENELAMDFLFINTQELSALMGLPYIQQLTYLVGIRPYMDRKTHITGIKRRISYKQLAEQLYIEGKLRSNHWTDGDGNNRQSLSIVVNNIQLLSQPKSADETSSKTAESHMAEMREMLQESSEDVPF